jgi:regulator of CtrA degradation
MRQVTVYHRTYDETVDLMVEARNYMQYVENRERARVDAIAGLRLSCEAMRVTSRLTQVMAWLMMQRAVHEGEISADEAVSEHNRLSGADVCLDVSFADDASLPRGLKSLLSRSYLLYLRIFHLEEQILSRLPFLRAAGGRHAV